jgi:putative DNA-invertase from lambdoid prophage Rac
MSDLKNDTYTIYAYLRVSTDKQNIENNRSEILLKINDMNLDSRKIIWITETITGTKHWKKRKLGEINFKKGDYFFCSELSRVGRKMIDVMEFISGNLQKGINIIFTKTNFTVDDSITSQTLIFAYSLCSQIERNLISERTRSILQTKKDNGVKLGRKCNMKLDDKAIEIKNLYDDGYSMKGLAKKYNCTRLTINRLFKKHNLKDYSKEKK